MRHAGHEAKRVLLDIARHFCAGGSLGTKAVMLALLRHLTERSVIVLRHDRMLSDDIMDRCHAWADDHVGLLVVGGGSARKNMKDLVNLARPLLRGTCGTVDVTAAFAMSPTEGVVVSILEAAAVAVARPEMAAEDCDPELDDEDDVSLRDDANPPFLTGLPAALVLPELGLESVGRGSRRCLVMRYAPTGHRWYVRGAPRPARDRSGELDRLLASVEGLAARRGWVAAVPPAAVVEASSHFVRPSAGREVAFGVLNGKAVCCSDRLWRITKRHVYYWLRRQRLAVPEHVGAIYRWPTDHVVFDRLSSLLSSQQALRLMSQGVHGDHGELVARLFSAVAGASGRRVRAGFWGCGALNTVAMMFDKVLGSESWDYALRVEGNPEVARIHDHCWDGRVLAIQERNESVVCMPDGVSPPKDCVITDQCQPWSWLNRYGLDSLERAVVSRAAMYRAVSALDPDIVVDEMLSRAKMAGKNVAWLRVEYIRHETFGPMEWLILDSDPGDMEEGLGRSRRELAVGYKLEFSSVVRAVLEGAGFRAV